MEEYTLIQLKLSKEFDYELNLHLANLRRLNLIQPDENSKAKLIIKLARIGLLKESVK